MTDRMVEKVGRRIRRKRAENIAQGIMDTSELGDKNLARAALDACCFEELIRTFRVIENFSKMAKRRSDCLCGLKLAGSHARAILAKVEAGDA